MSLAPLLVPLTRAGAAGLGLASTVMPEVAGRGWQTVILVGRNPGRLQHAAAGLGAVRSGWPLA